METKIPPGRQLVGMEREMAIQEFLAWLGSQPKSDALRDFEAKTGTSLYWQKRKHGDPN